MRFLIFRIFEKTRKSAFYAPSRTARAN